MVQPTSEEEYFVDSYYDDKIYISTRGSFNIRNLWADLNYGQIPEYLSEESLVNMHQGINPNFRIRDYQRIDITETIKPGISGISPEIWYSVEDPNLAGIIQIAHALREQVLESLLTKEITPLIFVNKLYRTKDFFEIMNASVHILKPIGYTLQVYHEYDKIEISEPPITVKFSIN